MPISNPISISILFLFLFLLLFLFLFYNYSLYYVYSCYYFSILISIIFYYAIHDLILKILI